jgi:LytS/YehU family sensor histidine kinase
MNLVFQYLVAMTICAGIGQVHIMYQHQRLKEMEIEQLKLETLQSRYEALTNQINPHFFFNALNSLTGLIRNAEKDHTIKFVDKLSDVFRYILRSDKKGLVKLEEELEFMKSYQYLIEIRFAKKLSFNTVIANDKKPLKLPVLSLLPLIENIVQHNAIDSENKMKIDIYINDNDELIISNPVHPKLEQSVSHNTGLANLDSRFLLLTKKHIRIINDSETFTVYLPLVKE